MAEGGGARRLALEALDELLVVGVLVPQDLERHIPAEGLVVGQEDPRHAPAAKQIAQDVAIVDDSALYGPSGVAFEGSQLSATKSRHCFPPVGHDPVIR